MNNTPAPFDRQEIIRRERHLAKYANTMDSLFCIPFTKQGIGIDALLSLIPFVGDIAGLLLTLKAFRMGRELGVPEEKMRPAVYLALADMLLGMIPVVGHADRHLFATDLPHNENRQRACPQRIRHRHQPASGTPVHARGAGKETGTIRLLAQTCRRLALSAPARLLRPRHAGFDDLGTIALAKWTWSGLSRLFATVSAWF